MQGKDYVGDFLVMNLGGCEVALRVHWLAMLGNITWNFKDLTMQFEIDQAMHCLQGLNAASLLFTSEQNTLRMLQHGHQAYLAQIQVAPAMADADQEIPAELEPLLREFEMVFHKPNGLPPPRSKDHQISLIEGARPVNISPKNIPYCRRMRWKAWLRNC